MKLLRSWVVNSIFGVVYYVYKTIGLALLFSSRLSIMWLHYTHTHRRINTFTYKVRKPLNLEVDSILSRLLQAWMKMLLAKRFSRNSQYTDLFLDDGKRTESQWKNRRKLIAVEITITLAKEINPCTITSNIEVLFKAFSCKTNKSAVSK